MIKNLYPSNGNGLHEVMCGLSVFNPDEHKVIADYLADLEDVIGSLLNCEGAAKRAARYIAVDAGLDVAYHFNKARSVMAKWRPEEEA